MGPEDVDRRFFLEGPSRPGSITPNFRSSNDTTIFRSPLLSTGSQVETSLRTLVHSALLSILPSILGKEACKALAVFLTAHPGTTQFPPLYCRTSQSFLLQLSFCWCTYVRDASRHLRETLRPSELEAGFQPNTDGSNRDTGYMSTPTGSVSGYCRLHCILPRFVQHFQFGTPD